MKILVIHSGGLDSTALLWRLRAEGNEVRALSFLYGQKHAREVEAARELCSGAGIPWALADLSSVRELIAGASSQLRADVPVPEGHYTAESMKATVVPNRNMIMLAVAIGHAISEDLDAVAYGAHAGDHAIYPDCREPFAAAMESAARVCDWKSIELLRPFVHKTKAEIVALAMEDGAPLASTWSCYKGGARHCGKCGTCVERREAFDVAGVLDPTEYGA